MLASPWSPVVVLSNVLFPKIRGVDDRRSVGSDPEVEVEVEVEVESEVEVAQRRVCVFAGTLGRHARGENSPTARRGRSDLRN